MVNITNGPEIPMGLGIALAKDISAMNYYAGLPRKKKQQIIERTHSIQSKEEMQAFVASLVKGS